MSIKLREAIETITLAGYQVEARAFELLKISETEQYFDSLIAALLNDVEKLKPSPVVITREILEKTLIKVTREKEIQNITEIPRRLSVPFAKEIDSDLEIIQDMDEKVSSGTIDDFNRYFKDRFERLSKILHERLDFKDARTIASALEAKYGEKIRTIAIVMSKRERTDHLFLEIEDKENTATIMVIQQKNREVFEAARKILLDQVIGIEAIRGKNDLFVAEQIVLPDIPEKRLVGADCPINAVLLSDIHAGSNTFCADAFKRLIMWLNGKVGNPRQIEAALKTKYVLIVGDLVDGVGVYPRQENELSITNIYEQYKFVAQYFEQIPDYMEVVIIPGNHDAVRQALPQPPIPKEFADPIYEARNITSLGNPAEVRLHGIHFLLYHGRSLDDVIARVPNLSMGTPEKAMEYLLKCRHLAPEYGARTSLAPESRDRLIITRPPDVFQAGHIHVVNNSVYRGTMVVNCGAWQTQTEYQRRIGIEPTPGIMPLLNLQKMELSKIDFMTNETIMPD